MSLIQDDIFRSKVLEEFNKLSTEKKLEIINESLMYRRGRVSEIDIMLATANIQAIAERKKKEPKQSQE